MLLIKNGRVIDPASKTDAAIDVLLDGEKIKEVAPVGKIAAPQDVEVFDATGLIVAPGFIDLHAHLREPGQESSETIETGTRAAARGGFTAVCCMPNTKPVNDNASVTRFILDRAKTTGSVRVWPIGAASMGSKGEAIAEIAGMKEAGIVAVSDDGKPIATAKLARQVMEYCRSLDLTVIEHAEDVSLACGAVMREGVTSTRLGLRGMPAAAESVCVARDVQLAELTGARLHIAHLSARASLEQVRWAKSRKLRVSCEVTPHHFTLIDEDVAYDSHFKMNPPLASREDRKALIEGLADGTIDAIATDHAPHEPALKDVEFDRAPFGILGFETALALALEQLVATGRVSLMRMVELFTTGPARVLGVERKIATGQVADLTIFSLDQTWTYNVKESVSKSRNSPFDGRRFKGGPVATIVAGRIVERRG
ncbi:MAG: dihydroorotase [Acidobacteria bacterium]|nr:MAG: dihydroorotase [Acidobacteria bacterium 13_1_40CM_4_58_4]PYT59161.1 MAG: dihydroorotase [Acidobacteriota bacterium]